MIYDPFFWDGGLWWQAAAAAADLVLDKPGVAHTQVGRMSVSRWEACCCSRASGSVASCRSLGFRPLEGRTCVWSWWPLSLQPRWPRWPQLNPAVYNEGMGHLGCDAAERKRVALLSLMCLCPMLCVPSRRGSALLWFLPHASQRNPPSASSTSSSPYFSSVSFIFFLFVLNLLCFYLRVFFFLIFFLFFFIVVALNITESFLLWAADQSPSPPPSPPFIHCIVRASCFWHATLLLLCPGCIPSVSPMSEFCVFCQCPTNISLVLTGTSALFVFHWLLMSILPPCGTFVNSTCGKQHHLLLVGWKELWLVFGLFSMWRNEVVDRATKAASSHLASIIWCLWSSVQS